MNQPEKKSSRGLYRRVAVAQLAMVAAVTLAHAALFWWLLQVTNGLAASDLRDHGLQWNQNIATKLSLKLSREPDCFSQCIGAFLKATDPTGRVFVILVDATMIGPVPATTIRNFRVVFPLMTDRTPQYVAESVIPQWSIGSYRGALLEVEGRVVGVLGIAPLSTFQRLWPLMVGVSASVLSVAILLFSVFLVAPLRRRLGRLQEAAIRFGGGDATIRVTEDGQDEIADVGRAFNEMAETLTRRAKQIETSDRIRRQLVADVSHELMTPLTAVIGHIETLEMNFSGIVALDRKTQKDQLTVALREARRLQHLIKDLLDVARLEAGGGQLNFQKIDLADLVSHVVAKHRQKGLDRRISLTARIDSPVTVDGDAFRIEQALDNLVSNALRHTPNGGQIAIEVSAREDLTIIEVSDDGPGVTPEHLPHIFDRFYKASSGRIASPGSGLGLSIVKAIVERHGGRVAAVSDHGLRVRMELPRRAAEILPVDRAVAV